MVIHDAVLRNSEKIVFSLRELYRSHGFNPYRMSKFEEYDLYAENKDFLVSDHVITFNDTDGKLLALKPDVTLSIIKNTQDTPTQTQKIYYDENVYRVSKGSGSFQEITQTGVECFGMVNEAEIVEVLTLAAQSIRLLSEQAVLAISDLGILSDIVARLGLDGEKQKAVFQAIGEKNIHEIETLCRPDADVRASRCLIRLLSLSGRLSDVRADLTTLLRTVESEAQSRFLRVLDSLEESPLADAFYIDFSVTGDIHYYNGIIFHGFLRNIPTVVLSGGQYDRLMQRMGRKSSAIGFAVYTDALDRWDVSDFGQSGPDDSFVNIALPKGRLGEAIYERFAAAGFPCPGVLEPNRKLIFENREKRVRYFWVKPSDVPIYVERGAADIGVAGKDILLEYEPDVYELLDLKKGKCRMAVAAPTGYIDDPSRTLRVATKFAHIAKQHYRALGRDIDIIHLNGSIEIAPILGLSDVIVDIVETGTTLRENHLEIIDTLIPISARLIANKSAYKFKGQQIDGITKGLGNITEENT